MVLLNTAIVLVVGGGISLIVATVFAWFMERTQARMGWASSILPLLPLMVPSLAGSVGWVALLSPDAGLVNVGIRNTFGLVGFPLHSGPIDIFSWGGFIFLYVLYLIPFAYIVVAAALRNMDPALEEAARVNGASLFRIFFTVTLPAVKPALAAAVVMELIIGFAMFTVPVTVGASAGIEVLSVRIYRLLTFAYPAQADVAVVLSILMLIVVSLAAGYQRHVTAKGRHSTIGGRASTTSLLAMGKGGRRTARAVLLFFVGATTVIPLFGLFFLSLQSFWTPKIKWEKLNFNNYSKVFSEFSSTEALTNSLMLGLICGAAVMLVASIMALYLSRANGVGSKLVGWIGRLPSTIPHLVIAVAFIIALAGPPFNLGGTPVILAIAYGVMYLPQAVISATSAHAQIGLDMTQAARVAGANEALTFRRITLPLMWPGIVAGFALCFVLVAGEVTGSVLLAGPSTPVIGSTMIAYWNGGNFGLLAALSSVVSLLFTAVVLVSLWMGRRSSRGTA
jgi:iron(III) transport system permease protein